MALVATACSGGSGSDGDSDVITLQYASHLSANSPYGLTTQWWADEIETRSGGRIQFEFFWDGTIAGSGEGLRAIGDGRVEAGDVTPGQTPGMLPLSGVDVIPFDTNNVTASMIAFNEVSKSNELFSEEYERNGLKFLATKSGGQGVIGSSTRIDGVDGLSGLDFRVIPSTSAAFQATGATPIVLGTAEVYEGMQRGTIDAYGSVPLDLVPSFSLQEVTEYVVADQMGEYASVIAVMNLDAWNALDPELQAVITDVSEEIAEHHTGEMARVEDEACQTLADAGTEIVVWDESEYGKWRSALGDEAEPWVASAVASGLSEDDARAFIDEWRGFYEEAVADKADAVQGLERCASQRG